MTPNPYLKITPLFDAEYLVTMRDRNIVTMEYEYGRNIPYSAHYRFHYDALYKSTFYLLTYLLKSVISNDFLNDLAKCSITRSTRGLAATAELLVSYAR